jgi:parallel beta-helix repeat protein
VAALHPGDTLYVRGGTYGEALLNDIPSGTSWSAPVTVAAYPGEAVTLQAPASAPRGIDLSGAFAYIELDNLILDGSKVTSATADGVKISYGKAGAYAHDIRLKGLEVRDFSQNGVLLTEDPSLGDLTRYNQVLNCSIHDNGTTAGHGIYIESSYNTVSGNTIYNNGEYGIHIYRDSGVNGTDASDNTVSGNRVYDNGFGLHSNGAAANGWGIGLFVGDANVAYNNLVYGNKGGGIYSDLGASNSKVLDNSVYDNQLNSGIELDSGSTGALVRDNVAYGNPGGDYSNGGVSTAADHNLFGTDPQWVNPAGGDFHLQATSKAIASLARVKKVAAGLMRDVRKGRGLYYAVGE